MPTPDGDVSRFTIELSPGEPLVLADGDDDIRLRPKERAALVALVLNAPDPIDADSLIDLMWGGDAPASARQSLHNHLARLRNLAPGLVNSGRRGYALSHDVQLRATGWTGEDDDSEQLADLPEHAATRRLLSEFIRQRSSPTTPGLDVLLDQHEPGELVAGVEASVAVAPLDERRWWELMVVYAMLGRPIDALDAFERAHAQLADVGLEPSRRLHDVDRMVRDGVTDRARLMADPFGRSDSNPMHTIDLRTDDLDAVRTALSSDDPFLVVVSGDPGRTRTGLLARVLHEARVHGFDGCLIRCAADSALPPEPRQTWSPHRPALIAIDHVDAVDAVDALTRRLRDTRATPVAQTSTSFAVAVTDPAQHRFDESLPVVTIEAPPDAVELDPDIELLPGSTLELLDTLVLLDEPVAPVELSEIVDDIDHAVQAGLRAGVLIQDMRTRHVDTATPSVRRAVAARLDEPRRAALALSLTDLELELETPMHRAVRQARLLAAARGGGHPDSVDRALAAIEICRQAGRFDVAASTARNALRAIEDDVGRTLDWCRVALEVGRFELAIGVKTGETALLDAVEVSRRLGDHELMSRGTQELCRLGTVATAGSSDPRSASLIETLLNTVERPVDRARVGAAAAMVFSFAGVPDRLRDIFETAVDDARASGHDELLCDVLPMAYMSLPLHSDIDRRFEVADELESLATQLDRSDARWESLHLRLATEVMSGGGDPRTTYLRLAECSESLYERSRSWEMHYVRSGIALLDGDLDDARRHIDDSMTFAGDVNEDRVAAVFGAHHVAASLVDGSIGGFIDVTRQLVADQPEVIAWSAAFACSAAHVGAEDEARATLTSMLEADTWILDHTYSPAMVCLADAAAILGDRRFLEYARRALEPMAGTWSWCGSCTFGPIDLSLAKVLAGLDDHVGARAAAARAVGSAAELRAPRYVDLATAILLTLG